LAADWIRLSPEWATVTQYFGGEEQAALDRQLTPLTEAHRALHRSCQSWPGTTGALAG
jgi:hypothetical protein